MALPNKPSIKNVWASSGLKVEPSDNKVNTGWIVERPPHQFQNFLQNRSDQFLKHINEAGIPVWDAVTVYTAGKSYVQGSDGKLYKAITGGANSNPVGNPTNWMLTLGETDFQDVIEQTEDNALAASTSAATAVAAKDTALSTLAVFDDEPPASPLPGRHWTSNITGKSYEYIVDADSGQWVEQGGPQSISSTAIADYLAAPTGADAIGASDGNTVQDNLNEIDTTLLDAARKSELADSTTPGKGVAQVANAAVSVLSPVQVRALSNIPNGARVTMQRFRNNVMIPAKGGGDLFVDRNDTTTADDGYTVFVMADGARAKRSITGKVWASWFGTYGDGTNSDSAAIQAAVTFVGDKLELCFDPQDTHLFTAPVTATGRLNARSESVKGLIGTTVFDGSGLADGETCIYFNSTYNQLKGFKFLGKGRLVNGVSLGRLVGSTIYAGHSTVLESCEFVQCRNAITSKYACQVRVESCKFDSCYKGIELDKTSNTWKIDKCVVFNFLAESASAPVVIAANASHSFIHVIDADQVTIRDIWCELNSVPVVQAERFSNIRIESPWIEHLVTNNAQPLFLVNGSTILNPYNFVVEDGDLITNYSILATLNNLQNFELRNVRVAGQQAPSVFPIINCDTVDLVRMSSVYCEYTDNPSTIVNRIVVNGANRVDRDDRPLDLVQKDYSNQVFDSSFKTITNTAVSGDATRTLDTTVGVHDNNSMKIAFGALGTGRARTANNVNLVGGQYVRLSAWMWTDSDTLFNKVILRIAGPTSGKNRQVSLTKTPRRYDLIWQVPATGFDGAYFAFFDYSVVGTLRAYNVWVDDVQIVVDSSPIPYLPYVMNNSLTAPMKIGTGLNSSEHTLLGGRVTRGAAAPTAGTWAPPDICYNSAPAASGNIGWVCVTAGTPGTWKSFGSISA